MREYRTEDIIVYWYPEICSQPGVCTRTLPGVFSKNRRPWVDLSQATAEEIIHCIDRCPSGALRYALPEGSRVDPALARGPGSLDFAERDDSPVVLKSSGKGPMIVTGPLTVIKSGSDFVRKDSRIVLCGCGRSKNRPFCDGTHMEPEE